jgi:hypothetical protein
LRAASYRDHNDTTGGNDSRRLYDTEKHNSAEETKEAKRKARDVASVVREKMPAK